MRGVIGNQNAMIAHSSTLYFLNCSLPNFSNLNKRFYPQVLESISVSHTSIKKILKHTNHGFFYFDSFIVLIWSQTLKKLWYVKVCKQVRVKWIKDACRHKMNSPIHFHNKTRNYFFQKTCRIVTFKCVDYTYYFLEIYFEIICLLLSLISINWLISFLNLPTSLSSWQDCPWLSMSYQDYQVSFHCVTMSFNFCVFWGLFCDWAADFGCDSGFSS